MKKGEKQQKFHQSLIQMLYPSSRSPPRTQEDEIKEKEKKLTEMLYDLPDDLGNEESDESEDNEEGNVGSEKLTRAQRKRLRKNKLKENGSHRRKIIGPLLPGTVDGGEDGIVGCISGNVRQNASVRLDSTIESSGEPASSTKQNKLKQRRKSKKLADTKLNSSTIDDSNTNTSN